MKVTDNKVAPYMTDFQPITVTILIETKDEYNALLTAEKKLSRSGISDEFTYEHRDAWITTLELIARRAKAIYDVYK